MAGLFRGQNRRGEARQGVNLDAFILPGGHRCRVKDLSPSGCRVQIAHPSRLPDTIVLVLMDKGVAYQGSVRWRDTDHLGIKIERSSNLEGIVPATFVAAKALWVRER